MLSVIGKRLISLLQLILVVIYIIFEEFVWEGLAKPIYKFVHNFGILQKIEAKLHQIHAYFILVLFIVLLSVVQSLGFYAGILFISGQILLGISFYLAKIPVAAFTFWVFRVTEDKLMKFTWFRYLYERVMQAVEWLKSRDIYLKSIDILGRLKLRFKVYVISFKNRYLAGQNTFIIRVKQIYKNIKQTLKK